MLEAIPSSRSLRSKSLTWLIVLLRASVCSSSEEVYDGGDALALQEVITGKGGIDIIRDDGDTVCAGGQEYGGAEVGWGLRGTSAFVSCQARKRIIAISSDCNERRKK